MPSHKPELERRALPHQVTAVGLNNKLLFLSGVPHCVPWKEVAATINGVIQHAIHLQGQVLYIDPAQLYELCKLGCATSGDQSFKIKLTDPELAYLLTDWQLWPQGRDGHRPWSCTWFGAASRTLVEARKGSRSHYHCHQPAGEDSSGLEPTLILTLMILHI